MQKKLLKQIEQEILIVNEGLESQWNSICELKSRLDLISYLLYLMTNDSSRLKELDIKNK